jgi:hypothetical protein
MRADDNGAFLIPAGTVFPRVPDLPKAHGVEERINDETEGQGIERMDSGAL